MAALQNRSELGIGNWQEAGESTRGQGTPVH
jgi:hypothetical protein